MIYTINNRRIFSLSRSLRRGCNQVQHFLVHSTFLLLLLLLLLLDSVEPRARVIPKRINLCYSFGSETT